MSDIPFRFKNRTSKVSGFIPDTTGVLDGEFFIQQADKAILFKDADGNLIQLKNIQTGNFVTTSQTGNFGGANVDLSAYITTAQTGIYAAAAGTGNFVTTAQTGIYAAAAGTGNFVTTAQTGIYASAADTGNFVTTAQTGIYAAAAGTGNFVTTAQTGIYAAAAGTGNFVTTAQTGIYAAAAGTGNFIYSINGYSTGLISVINSDATSTVGSNAANKQTNTIISTQGNTQAWGSYNTIISSQCALNCGSYSAIIAQGYSTSYSQITPSSSSSVLMMGSYNVIYSSSSSAILGGNSNTLYSSSSFIINSANSTVCPSAGSSIILNSYLSCIQQNTSYSLLFNSNRSCLNNGSYSSIINACNSIICSGYNSAIIGGNFNCIRGCDNAILSSKNSTISGSCMSLIIGGTGNCISGNASGIVIVGGCNITATGLNTVYANNYCSINGKYYGDGSSLTLNSNVLCTAVTCGTLICSVNGDVVALATSIGGAFNCSLSTYSAVLGGSANKNLGNGKEIIVGGTNNCTVGCVVGIMSACNSVVCSTSCASAIVGGCANRIGGMRNCAFPIFGSTNSIILGGHANIIYSGFNSAILGGTSNDISGAAYGVVILGGSGIVACGTNTTYSNNFCAFSGKYFGDGSALTGLATGSFINLAQVNTFNTVNASNVCVTGGYLAVGGIEENIITCTSGASGLIDFDVCCGATMYYIGNSTANFYLNLRSDSTATINSILETNKTLTVTFLNTNGLTAYPLTGVAIDGTGRSIKWLNGTGSYPAGNIGSIDSYSITAIKTGDNLYTVLGSQGKFI